MPIADLVEYEKSISAANSYEYFVEFTAASVATYFDIFANYVNQSTLLTFPSTAVACNKSTSGALNANLNNFSPAECFITSTTYSAPSFSNSVAIVIDRLSHQGGLSLAIGTSQTTNLPTAALPRYTDGVGVMAMTTIYNGTSTNTGTVSYTNQSGTSGRTGTFRFNTAVSGNCSLVNLQSGDTGIRSIQSLQFSTAAGGGAGNLGIALFKPLCMIGVGRHATSHDFKADFVTGEFLGGIPKILDDACLCLLTQTQTIYTSTNADILGSFNFYSP